MTDGFTVSLRTIPPGSIIKRHEQHPDGLPIFLEWEEPDGSLHVMRITADATSPVGFRVDETSVTVAPDAKLTIGGSRDGHTEGTTE